MLSYLQRRRKCSDCRATGVLEILPALASRLKYRDLRLIVAGALISPRSFQWFLFLHCVLYIPASVHGTTCDRTTLCGENRRLQHILSVDVFPSA
jgi:hypothetical protein